MYFLWRFSSLWVYLPKCIFNLYGQMIVHFPDCISYHKVVILSAAERA